MSSKEEEEAGTNTSDSGYVIVPGSRRPDGTFRKDVKVRAGYVPQEEMPLYESKGKKLARELKESAPPGWSSLVDDKPLKPKTKAQLKNEKRKAKKATTAPTRTTTTTTTTTDAAKKEEKQEVAAEENTEELTKQLRTKKKKLKQIEEIQQKASTGVALNADQQQKLSKRSELEREIEELQQKLSTVLWGFSKTNQQTTKKIKIKERWRRSIHFIFDVISYLMLFHIWCYLMLFDVISYLMLFDVISYLLTPFFFFFFVALWFFFRNTHQKQEKGREERERKGRRKECWRGKGESTSSCHKSEQTVTLIHWAEEEWRHCHSKWRAFRNWRGSKFSFADLEDVESLPLFIA